MGTPVGTPEAVDELGGFLTKCYSPNMGLFLSINATLLGGFALVLAVFVFGLWYDRKDKDD